MDNIEKIMNDLKSMDKSKRNELLDTLESSMTAEQQKKLKKLLAGKSGKAQLEQELSGMDIDRMLKGVKSGADLEKLLKRDDVSKKLREMLG